MIPFTDLEQLWTNEIFFKLRDALQYNGNDYFNGPLTFFFWHTSLLSTLWVFRRPLSKMRLLDTAFFSERHLSVPREEKRTPLLDGGEHAHSLTHLHTSTNGDVDENINELYLRLLIFFFVFMLTRKNSVFSLANFLCRTLCEGLVNPSTTHVSCGVVYEIIWAASWNIYPNQNLEREREMKQYKKELCCTSHIIQ